MKIITIGREFGSGGRELGKRLADLTGFDYYDQEILHAIAEKKAHTSGYPESAVAFHAWRTLPLVFHHSFADEHAIHMNELIAQKEVLEEISALERDCIIIGQDADVILKEKKPFRIFVCAELNTRVKRCMERAEGKEKEFSEKEMKRNIKRIDKYRAQTRELVSGSKWGTREGYDLIVNSTDWRMQELAESIKDYMERWFARK